MKTLTVMLTAALLCPCAPAMAHARCNLASFGHSATSACGRNAKGCLFDYKNAPAEIRSIARGVAMTWVGYISPGPITYIALDIDKRRAMKIQIFCPVYFNPPPPKPPQIKSPTPYNHETSVPGADGMTCVKHVQIHPLSLPQVTRLACSLNPFWSKSFKPYENWHVSDTASTVWLLLPYRAREGMVSGVFTGPVAHFSGALLKLFASRFDEMTGIQREADDDTSSR